MIIFYGNDPVYGNGLYLGSCLNSALMSPTKFTYLFKEHNLYAIYFVLLSDKLYICDSCMGGVLESQKTSFKYPSRQEVNHLLLTKSVVKVFITSIYLQSSLNL